MYIVFAATHNVNKVEHVNTWKIEQEIKLKKYSLRNKAVTVKCLYLIYVRLGSHQSFLLSTLLLSLVILIWEKQKKKSLTDRGCQLAPFLRESRSECANVPRCVQGHPVTAPPSGNEAYGTPRSGQNACRRHSTPVSCAISPNPGPDTITSLSFNLPGPTVYYSNKDAEAEPPLDPIGRNVHGHLWLRLSDLMWCRDTI